MRTAVCSLIALAACNPADIKDRAVQFPASEQVDDGSFLSVLGGTITVNEAARTNVESWEVEAGAGFIYQTDDPPVGEISLTTGLLQEVARGGLSDGSASAVWSDPDFANCNGAGFEIQENASCTLGVVIFVGVDRASQFTADLSVKGWLADDATVDPESLVASTTLEVAQTEE